MNLKYTSTVKSLSEPAMFAQVKNELFLWIRSLKGVYRKGEMYFVIVLEWLYIF